MIISKEFLLKGELKAAHKKRANKHNVAGYLKSLDMIAITTSAFTV